MPFGAWASGGSASVWLISHLTSDIGLSLRVRERAEPPGANPASTGANGMRCTHWYIPRPHNRHIERGGGTGPKKPRQPPRKGKGANSSRWICLEDVSGVPTGPLLTARRRSFHRSSSKGDGDVGTRIAQV